ncbi:MAG: TRAP transporter large permease subunit [Paracoccaceae bacterium]
MGFDPIWFGVIAVIVIEMGMITPPVGLNVFVVKGVVADADARHLPRCVAVLIAMLVCLLLIVAVSRSRC